MISIGIDIGASSIKAVAMEDGRIICRSVYIHKGRITAALKKVFAQLSEVCENAAVSVTGCNSKLFAEFFPEVCLMDDIPAIVEGVRNMFPRAGSIISIGSQQAGFITDLDKPAPQFSLNEHCAGGTGSFFEDQMSRLGQRMEDYSDIVAKAGSVPRLSGRCAVFAKTDIIHRQQEGVSIPDILLGLCYAMIKNYKAVIVKGLEVKKPVAFVGGVTINKGVIRAVKDVFGLAEDELLFSDDSLYAGAIGAAINAKTSFDLTAAVKILDEKTVSRKSDSLPPLELKDGIKLCDPPATGSIPAEGCALGIDIGSTSTDLVLVDSSGSIIDMQYLRTAGNPKLAVRKGLEALKAKYGKIKFTAVGVTGSGRELIGRLIGADVVRDEITAQARAAVFCVPEADTVFEIGGQDSKYISLKDGDVCDFQMNKVCAAGTGSFVEEQAARMGIPIGEFGKQALSAQSPCQLGERCTVFIETAITSAEAEGASPQDIAAGLCHSIILNYLHKVVAGKPVGKHIVLQGGVCYNPGIVAAFQAHYGDRITVSPCFSVSGAFGAAMLAMEEHPQGESRFRGFDFDDRADAGLAPSRETQKNIEFYYRPRKLLLKDYDPVIDPKKKTVGIPMVLVLHKFFPLANAFFKDLGFNVVISGYSDEETIRLAQQYARSETCYPVKLIYGHFAKLAQMNVDYIFLPAIHTMTHAASKAAYSYGCAYMQSAAKSVYDTMGLKDKGIELLCPLFDLDFGKKAMVMAMLGLGAKLGFAKPRCMKALLKGAMCVREFDAQTEKWGRELLADIKPDEKALVMITRNYGVNDPVLNMGIPERLLERGCKVITLSHLPGHDIDISEDHPNMYWAFGEHILSGAKIIAAHPNLYAVYLTNHGCGPDSMLSHLFKEEMGGKPYLQIEVDEHYSPVGVITRIEAFLHSLSRRENAAVEIGHDIKNVRTHKAKMYLQPKADKTLYIPDIGKYTLPLCLYYKENYGVKAQPISYPSEKALVDGRAETYTKEYMSFARLLGESLHAAEKGGANAQILIPSTQGAEADGMFARVIRSVLDEKGFSDTDIIYPIAEEITKRENADMLFRALAYGDILYALNDSDKSGILPSWEELCELAKKRRTTNTDGKKLALVGTPLCISSMNEGVAKALCCEGYEITRMSLAEYLWFLAADKNRTDKKLAEIHSRLAKVFESNDSFEQDGEELFKAADRFVANISAGNLRYRYAKAVLMSKRSDAVLTASPRYENSAVVMDMRRLADNCEAPVFNMSFDGDWDEAAWSRLRSFLYYLDR